MEVEKKEEVAMEMSDLVVYCQPRSKEKDRFGKDTQTLVTTIWALFCSGSSIIDGSLHSEYDILCDAQIKDLFFPSFM